jgi:hypothetical protein
VFRVSTEVTADVVSRVCASFGQVAKDVALVTLVERGEGCGKADIESGTVHEGRFVHNGSEFPARVRE